MLTAEEKMYDKHIQKMENKIVELAVRIEEQKAEIAELIEQRKEMMELLENLILEDDAAGGNMTDKTYNSIRAVIRKAKSAE